MRINDRCSRVWPGLKLARDAGEVGWKRAKGEKFSHVNRCHDRGGIGGKGVRVDQVCIKLSIQRVWR